MSIKRNIEVAWPSSMFTWSTRWGADGSYGKPISMDDYAKTFVEGDDAARKETVKRLTRKISTDVRQLTVNANDW